LRQARSAIEQGSSTSPGTAASREKHGGINRQALALVSIHESGTAYLIVTIRIAASGSQLLAAGAKLYCGTAL
jgi:hypothetical protein